MGRDSYMALSAFMLPSGYDRKAWRLPGSRSGEYGRFDLMRETAVKFEAAKVDALFVADVISSTYIFQQNLMMGSPYEPLTTLSALSAVTNRIGLIGTFSTTWNHPFTLARQLAALDLLSGGRVGWNIVTSNDAAENYGVDLPDKLKRYERATEFLAVVKSLWTSWSAEAILNDAESGVWMDPSKVRQIDHEGEYFKVSGSLNIPRSPQGYPLLVQAGQSYGGIRFAAQNAEVVYTAQPEQSKAIEYYSELKSLAKAVGRNEREIRVLPGISTYIGATRKEAYDFKMSLAQYIDFDDAKARFEKRYGLDFSDIDLDERIPEAKFGDKTDDTAGTRFEAYKHLALEGGQTLRELLVNVESVGGHFAVTGTAEDVANTMINWFESYACDGFSLNPPVVPTSIDQLCNEVIPLLQERGYARKEYNGTTLREHVEQPIPLAWDALGEDPGRVWQRGGPAAWAGQPN